MMSKIYKGRHERKWYTICIIYTIVLFATIGTYIYAVKFDTLPIVGNIAEKEIATKRFAFAQDMIYDPRYESYRNSDAAAKSKDAVINYLAEAKGFSADEIAGIKEKCETISLFSKLTFANFSDLLQRGKCIFYIEDKPVNAEDIDLLKYSNYSIAIAYSPGIAHIYILF